MIKIRRAECPSALVDASSDRKQYDHPDVVARLHDMQNKKCCYCEKYIEKEGHEQAIEHFRPKAPNMYPNLQNEWKNLLHSCAFCNGAKWCHFPVDEDGGPLLIDPSDEEMDPEDVFGVNVDDEDDLNFGRMVIRHERFRRRGETTSDILKLNLIARRRDRRSDYIRLFEAYVDIAEARDDIVKRQKVIAFEGMLGANNRYAAFARAFARAKDLPERFGVRIPIGANVADP